MWVAKAKEAGDLIDYYLDDFDCPSQRKLPNFISFAKFSDGRYNCRYLSHTESLLSSGLCDVGS